MGYTALMMAAIKGKLETAKLLVEAGADLTLVDKVFEFASIQAHTC